MSRPQIIVRIEAALTRRGAPTATGTAFMAYAGATGPTTPLRCISSADAHAANVPAATAALIGDALEQGAPEVYVVKSATTDPATTTEAQWTTALALFDDSYGPGQALIPGVSTSAAHTALLDHANTLGRCVLLDGANNATATVLAAAATALADADGAERAGFIAPWVTVPAAGGATREVPGSVIAAGLAARGDGVVGHANHAPAGDQGRGAGLVRRGLDVTTKFTTAELDSLHDAGVSVIRPVRGEPTLYGWRSISSDDRFRQLNVGRMSMQLATGIQAGGEAFLFRNIDGEGRLFAELEGFLRGYLQPLWTAGALFGATADDAFDVQVVDVNTLATITAGELHSLVGATLTPHAEKVYFDVVTRTPEGAAA